MPESIRKAASAEVREQLSALLRDGYVVLPSLLDAEQCATIRAEAERLTSYTGRNPFEGHKTQRVYSPLAKTRAIDVLVDHPRILALLDALFLPNYLLSQAQIINLLPGEAAQPLHHDDAFYQLPRPFRPVHAAFICAIDPFTADNGATVLIPGSHTWGDDRMPERSQVVACEMAAGSAVFFLGNLWHGGGENRTERSRLAVTCQYCEPWLRQHENFFLEIPRAQARTLRESILSLLGYSIHAPFMGMVDGRHPRRSLERADDADEGDG
jgi:ectoine hydroxylase-related dioxygenase (phytanoyl-CoA dioxygenase family)